ncbi:F-box/FBD/LRR-repeat protein At1g13570-like [Vicia villosa]|uniref:F-box/FBD/LRR-repeat protein At1g13570-like n=1 Tax=Vicia villosa TaxID=3911 RepID=UPI00273AA391|nr:F-box/FBD/LRR-repeat protein At1g13570-like [Vicia villosa]
MTLLNEETYQNDRISDLPGNVIDVILGNLKIRDQIRTSILSTKWRYMWTSAPQLCFDQDLFEIFQHLDDPNTVISKIITDLLMGHNGPIHKFTLFIPYNSYFKITMEHLNMWIPILSRKDIKYLDLVNDYGQVYQMPYIVLSCKELTYFKVGGFKLSIPPNFYGFKRLLELHLVCVRFESGALENLMSGCPFLEKLNIELCDGFEYLDISSTTLKVLLLQLSDDMKSICLKKAKNLIDFTLDANHNSLSDSIKSLPKLKRFSLVRGKKNPYAESIPPTLLTSSFSSLEYLQLDDLNLNDKEDIVFFVSVLKSAPGLIEVVIKSHNDNDTSQVLDLSKELECRSCCLKFQTVDIYVRANPQYAMSLIQFILANSPSLKILTFNCNSKKLNARTLYRISQDLLWMKRTSPRAHVKFLLSTFP